MGKERIHPPLQEFPNDTILKSFFFHFFARELIYKVNLFPILALNGNCRAIFQMQPTHKYECSLCDILGCNPDQVLNYLGSNHLESLFTTSLLFI